ncbi:MAG: amino acid ABC transporter substrate-binding protein, partial [bacterium]
MIIKDDQSDPEKAAELYKEMLVDEKVDLIFGPYSSGITNAILPVTSEFGYPVLANGASSDKLWQQGYDHVFGLYIPAGKYTVGFLEMLKTSGMTDIAIVSADDPFSITMSEGTRKWAERFGLNVVYFRRFKKGTSNLDDIAEEAKRSGASALIVCGHFNESVDAKRSLSNIRWQPAAYYASVGPVLQKYYDVLGKYAENSFSSSQWEYHPKLSFPGSREFFLTFTETYGIKPSYHAASAFAGGTVLEAAVNKVGSLDRKKIREMLSTMDVMSILGRYGVDRTGMQIRQFPVIIQWQKGKKEIVWPKELRTAIPVFE